MSIIKKLDNETNIVTSILSSQNQTNYQTPVSINKEVDFIIEIENPTLDIYFETNSPVDLTELEGRFDDVFYALDFQAKKLESTANQFKFDSVIMNETQGLNINLTTENSSNFSLTIERLIEDTIALKIGDNLLKQTAQLENIMAKLKDNISKLSAKTLMLSYESSDIIKFFDYTSTSKMEGNVLQKGDDLILLYDLPIRLESQYAPTATAFENTSRRDIYISFGIKYHLQTNLPSPYYDPVGLSNSFYSD